MGACEPESSDAKYYITKEPTFKRTETEKSNPSIIKNSEYNNLNNLNENDSSKNNPKLKKKIIFKL